MKQWPIDVSKLTPEHLGSVEFLPAVINCCAKCARALRTVRYTTSLVRACGFCESCGCRCEPLLELKKGASLWPDVGNPRVPR